MQKVRIFGHNGPNYVEIWRAGGQMSDPRTTFPLSTSEQKVYIAARTLMQEGEYDPALEVLKVEFPNARMERIGEEE